MSTANRPPAWKILLAFAIICFVWGSSFLAIRIGVREVPPFLLAALRFSVAGIALYGWRILRGDPSPTARQWASISLLAFLSFVGAYGLLFWAEQRIPSGLAAVLLATIPAFMALCEILFLRTQKLTARLAAALLIGIGGVAVLVNRSLNLRGVPVDARGAAALMVGAISWSLASAFARKLPQPDSKVMNSGAQMLTGGMFLALAALLLGEFRDFHPSAVSYVAWLALLYLIVAASIIAFTAYVWLLHHESPTRVGIYAYVNPLVAVLLGYFVAGEALGTRTILGSLCILISVILITTTKKKLPS
jgi:drug/metabolite transporter (DMT)-like permease